MMKLSLNQAESVAAIRWCTWHWLKGKSQVIYEQQSSLELLAQVWCILFDTRKVDLLFSLYFKNPIKQISAKRGTDSRFLVKANLKIMCPKLRWGSILKSQSRVYTKYEYPPGSKMVKSLLLNQYSSLHQQIGQTRSTNCKKPIFDVVIQILLESSYHPWFDLVFDPK